MSMFGYFAIIEHISSILDKSVVKSFETVESRAFFQVCVTVSIARRLLKKYSSIKTKKM